MSELFNRLNELMVKYGFRPRKSLSQNFLIDARVILALVESAGLKPSDRVLEIGSGTGFLTQELLKHCPVIGIESDPVLAELLRKEIVSDSFELLEGDFLKLSLPSFSKIVCAPPYGISSELMGRLGGLSFDSAVMLLQSDFVAKLMSYPGMHGYNAVSVMAQYSFELEEVFRVPREAFFPKPSVMTSGLFLKSARAHGTARNEPAFAHFIKELFRFKNKNLSRAFKDAAPFMDLGKNSVSIVSAHPLAGKKVMQLEVHELVNVFNELMKK
ncbi:MAG: ribosomal RNA small subunit methyltransferase A [Candidatus Diapherotrites archaeon]|nr:ribosomal RNA small subunit methyltransferase A [Candidatus Diapherotrites archaeon]